ncbi:MAG: DUF3105 domain-containing protein [Actinomycetota bacterium]
MPGPLPVPWRSIALVTLLAAATAACGSDGADETTADSGCGPIVREPLDSGYLVHTLGNAEEPEYTTDPPTSGPHQPAPAVGGVMKEAMTRPVQVGVLERGDVLLQHDANLPAGDRKGLEELAGDGVVVAPNPELPAPIVATAWTYKRICQSADVAALTEFIDQRRGHGPDG